MAQKELTPRQKEIKALMSEGLKVPEIAKRMAISPNAVYQQRRRMLAAARKPGQTKPAQARKPAAPTTKPAPAPAPEVQVVARDQTPLQAVRARRVTIRTATSEVAQAVAQAQTALNAALAAEKKVLARHADELKQLDQAESALTGRKVVDGQPVKPKPAAKSAPGGNGREKPSEPASDAETPPSADAPTTSPTSSTNGTTADPAELARRGDTAAAAEAAEADAAAEAPQTS